MNLYKTNNNGKYFTGETREELISRLHLEQESPEIQEAYIQEYLARRDAFQKKLSFAETQAYIQSYIKNREKLEKRQIMKENVKQFASDITKDIKNASSVSFSVLKLLWLLPVGYILFLISHFLRGRK